MRRSLHHHSHHVAVLTKLIYYLDILLDQEGKGRHRAERVRNSKVQYVRYSISGSRRKFDYINRIVKCFRLRSMRVRRHTLPLVAMHLLDRSCVSVGIFLKLHATLPNSGIRARFMRRWYARVEHKELWARIVILLTTNVLF